MTRRKRGRRIGRKLREKIFSTGGFGKKIRMSLPLILPVIFGLLLPLLAGALQKEDTPLHDPGVLDVRDGEKVVSIYDAKTGEVFYQPLEEYVSAVVAAEMPASFEPEALKAQAVAARTYTLYKAAGTDKSAHKGADVCTDFAHCKAYADEELCRERFGDKYDYYQGKIKDAVNATGGEILEYEGKPILAVFHAMSSGKTESSADVWGGEKPYLVSVASTGDIYVEGYETKKEVTEEAFLSTLEKGGYSPDRTMIPENAIGEPTLTEGGSVKEINLYGVPLAGTKVRELFSLRSANFTLTFADDQFCFDVKGYGHGVGMSQQGANAMAKEGKTYKEILAWYYRDTTLVRQINGV